MSQMSKAATTGIQMVVQVSLAFLPMRNTGAAMRATTAGRMPLKTFST